jgi:hypothetical protein
MVVWFAHVRVGHRQLPIPKHPLTTVRGVLLCGLSMRFIYSYDVSLILLVILR